MDKNEILSLEDAKKFLRIDYEDDDNLIKLLIANAESYLVDAVDDFESKLKTRNNKKFKSKAKLAMLVLITNWYDSRDFTEIQVSEKVRYTITSIMKQMSFGDYNE